MTPDEAKEKAAQVVQAAGFGPNDALQAGIALAILDADLNASKRCMAIAQKFVVSRDYIAETASVWAEAQDCAARTIVKEIRDGWPI